MSGTVIPLSGPSARVAFHGSWRQTLRHVELRVVPVSGMYNLYSPAPLVIPVQCSPTYEVNLRMIKRVNCLTRYLTEPCFARVQLREFKDETAFANLHAMIGY